MLSLPCMGIDVSHWQGTIDWPRVRSSGVNFAIIKAGGSDKGFYTDSKFEENYKGATAVGLPVGAYYFVGPKCTSASDGEADAKRFAKIIEGKKFEMPVYLDFERPPAIYKQGNTDAAQAFCKYMEDAGYFVGIYGSDISGFKDRLDKSKLTEFSWWVARYGKAPVYAKPFAMWQTTCEGEIDGISTLVDLNICYKDFPAIMKQHHLNNC